MMDMQSPELRAAIDLCLRYDLTVASHGPEWTGKKALEEDHTVQIHPYNRGRYAVFYDGKKLHAGTKEEALDKFFEECNQGEVGDYYLDFGGSGCPRKVYDAIEEEEDREPVKIKTSEAKAGMTCILHNGKVGVIAGVCLWGLQMEEVLVMTEEGMQKHREADLDLRPELIYEYANGKR
jgi:hypothetical protein